MGGRAMRILGIDPGYAIVGFGALDYTRNTFTTLQYLSLIHILYVEASNHSSIVYTYDKTQSYALTFAQMEKLLPAEDFKKCHLSLIHI